MKYYMDCEFDGHTGPLLSIALVCEDGWSIHLRTTQVAKDPWVRQNVIPHMRSHNANRSLTVHLEDVGEALRAAIGDEDTHPVFVTDSPTDIMRFCAAITTDYRGLWRSSEYPRMTFEVYNVEAYPTKLEGAVQHNAWWDAMALKDKIERDHA